MEARGPDSKTKDFRTKNEDVIDEVYAAFDCLTTVANKVLTVNLVKPKGHGHAVECSIVNGKSFC